MKTLEQIQQQLYSGEFEFSRHAFKRAIEPLHLQISMASTDLVKIITIYQPDASQWNDPYAQRK